MSDAHGVAPQGVTAHGVDASGHAHGEYHPTWSTYWKVALILTVITVIEVWCYYLPAFVATPYFVPTLLFLSALKFAIVVLFYMHLKYDARLYRALFTGPFFVAMGTIIVLMFLFGKFAIHLSLLQ